MFARSCHLTLTGIHGLLLAAATALLLTGCASARFAKLETVPAVPADKGLVIFYRVTTMTNGAEDYQVHEGNRLVGVLRAGTFFHELAEPGIYTYWADAGIRSSVAIDVVEGQMTYIEGDLTPGRVTTNPRLRERTARQAQSKILKLRYAAPDESGSATADE
ncbi:MAG: hypothetical protein ACYTF9_05095 [Planctomycetota bacterium]|jgi:hypothetical protein